MLQRQHSSVREGKRGATEATQFRERRKARCYRGNTVQREKESEVLQRQHSSVREGKRGATEATQFRERRKARCYRGNTVQREEGKRGATEATQFKDILPGHKMQQWRKFVKGSHNKVSVITFLCKEWKKEEYRQKRKGKTLFLTYDQE